MEPTSDKLTKLNQLKAKGINPYAARYEVTQTAASALEQPVGSPVRIAGRIMSRRDFGKLVFCHLQDRTGRIQISFKKNDMSDADWDVQKNDLDIGDFIGIGGTIWATKTGEITVNTESLTFLSKSLLPLPEKWHGVKDREILYRKRYLDLLMNPETRERFAVRAKVVSLIRKYLDENSFVEVETPILQAAASGAAARPFVTRHNSLQQDLYLRISPETYLKRLVVGGLERVYEIGKNFRNEGLDPSHLQEFTMLEWYAAYWNYRDNMYFVRNLVQYLLTELTGGTVITYRGIELDFGGDWIEVEYRDAILNQTGIDILEFESVTDLASAVAQKYPGLSGLDSKSLPALIDALFKQVVRPKLIQPTFLVHHPTVLVPLARRKDDDPRLLDMFQVVVNSWEVVKAYSELVDPIDQLQRMLDQQQYRDEGDDETMMLEEDYIECMEYGMPPTSGLGLGIDRFVALLTDQPSLRDVVFFPNVKTKFTHVEDEQQAEEVS